MFRLNRSQTTTYTAATAEIAEKQFVSAGSVVIVVAALLIFGAAVRANAAGDEIIERVLAVAAGDVIMLSDVIAARDLGLVDVAQTGNPIRAVLSRLIDRSLILAEVDRYAPPEPSEQAISAALQTVRSRFPTAQAFQMTLSRVGLDEKRLGEILRQDLRIRAYLDQRFTAETADRRRTLIDEWVAGLRRRAQLVDLYEAAP